MIKVYTSYFYQIRNMGPGCLAFSTALGDPKYFHEFTGNPEHKFIDKRGVLNGLRAEPFAPRLDLPSQSNCRGPEECAHLQSDVPWYCDFLLAYKEMLLKLDVQDIEQRFRKVGQEWLDYNNKEMDLTYILLVHEAPKNPCSERVMLQWWLKHVGMGGEEWSKDLI